MLILAGVMLITLVPLTFFVIKVSPGEMGLAPYGADAQSVAADGAGALPGLTLKQATKTYQFWLVALAFALYNIPGNVASQTMSAHLTDVGYTIAFAATVSAIYMGALAIGKVILGSFFDKAGLKLGCIVVCIAMGFTYVGMYFAGNTIMLFSAVLCMGIGVSFGTIGNPTLTRELFGQRDYAAIYGIISAFASMGGLLAPIISNSLFEVFGKYGICSHIVDDYLLLFPEDRPRFEALVKSGKLIVGPWYIQPEEFLLSGETHIRNMLIGIKKSQAYGGMHMPVTYLCDMVGHIAQMPQLVKGFGMDYFVGWRGILDGKERDEAAYMWEAPDGSAVLMKDLTNGYYNFIPGDFESFEAKINEMYQTLEPYEKGEHILIMQGADHRPAIENTPDLIKQYNEKYGEDTTE